MKFLLVFLILGVLHVREALSAQCACATEGVHVRNGVGTSHVILTTLATHHCLTFKGNHRQDSAGDSWANVNYHGQDGWIHEDYITISTKTSCSGTTSSHGNSHVQLPGCPHIVTRAEWGARAPTSVSHLTQTPKYMFIHHGATAGCHTKAACIHQAQQYQNYHMDGHGWSDIGYSFLVGEDGNVYEARGWDRTGAHTKHYNDVGLAICVIGNFMDHPPNAAALNAVKQLIDCGHKNHKLTSGYMLKGHRDVGATLCPGDKLYDLIQHWPHYTKA